MSSQLLTLLVAVFGGAVAALITGLLTRPKTQADAEASRAAADVAVSGDSRAWAQFWADAAKAADEKATAFQQRADDAEARAEEAEEHAAAAQRAAARAHRRCDALEEHCRQLGQQITVLGGTVPAMPDVD